MKCPNCQMINPDNARFCMNCGTSLGGGIKHFQQAEQDDKSQAVPQQAAADVREVQPEPPRDYAKKMEAARLSHSMEGERRIVTILFCDVSGSTALAEGMDPEEWTAIMNRAFDYLIAPVYRYEGTVARLMGDAILAFFGAPIAHEDDPQRAILAGLDILESIQGFRHEMKQEYGLDFNLRVGINTGLVVVGSVGSDLRMEYTAMGDAINLAARMEQTAQPGTVHIAEDTYKRVSTLFEFEPLGAIEVKGKKERVQAYRVTGKREGAVQKRGLEGLHSPLVGRDAELSKLKLIVGQLLEGNGHIVSLIGEAGLGKSRLVAEMNQWASSMGWLDGPNSQPRIGWYEGRSLSYQTTTPYAPFLGLFSSLFSLNQPYQPGETPYARIKLKANEIGEQVGDLAPFLAALLGVEASGEDADRVKYLTPPQLGERIARSVPQLFSCLAEKQAVVLVFEDLHWIDTASLELIEQLLSLTERAPVLVLALFRPNRMDLSWRFHELGRGRYSGQYTPIMLQPLDEAQSRTLVANLLEIEDLPEKVRTLILRKAEGNPFFVEEVIRSLLDAHLVVRDGDHWRATKEVENIAVPDTLAGVITARLDRLDNEAHHVTQEAAVVGREFAYVVLSQIHEPGSDQAEPLDTALGVLQNRELVREKTLQPQRIYSFKHVLTQETAYASLLLSNRRKLHLRIAETLEKAGGSMADGSFEDAAGGVAGNLPGEIARHFVEAQQPGRALPYLIEAGNRAARTYATQEAISIYQKALEIAPQTAELQLAREAYEGLGRTLTFANRVQKAVENYQAMYSLGKDRVDIPMQVSALNKLSDIIAMRLGQFPEAEKLLSDAERLARQTNDKPGLAEMFMIRCGLCTATGDFAGAVNYLDQSVQVARSMEQKAGMALGLAHIANTQIWMTEFESAWQTAQQSLKISMEIGNRELQSEVLSEAIPFYHMTQGNYAEAYQAAAEGARVAASIGASFPESMGAFLAGRLAMEMGEYEIAMAWEQQSIQAGYAFGMPFLAVIGLCTLGWIYLTISETLSEKALEAHSQALKLLGEPGGAIAGGVAWADLGYCALALGEDERAAELFQKGLTIPSPQMLIMRPSHLIGLALIALKKNDLAEAQKYLDQARQFSEEKRLENYQPLLAFMQGRIQMSKSDYSGASESFERSEKEAARMGLRPSICQARAWAALALEKLGRLEEAEQRKEQAEAMLQEIASLFNDEGYRMAYLRSARGKE